MKLYHYSENFPRKTIETLYSLLPVAEQSLMKIETLDAKMMLDKILLIKNNLNALFNNPERPADFEIYKSNLKLSSDRMISDDFLEKTQVFAFLIELGHFYSDCHQILKLEDFEKTIETINDHIDKMLEQVIRKEGFDLLLILLNISKAHFDNYPNNHYSHIVEVTNKGLDALSNQESERRLSMAEDGEVSPDEAIYNQKRHLFLKYLIKESNTLDICKDFFSQDFWNGRSQFELRNGEKAYLNCKEGYFLYAHAVRKIGFEEILNIPQLSNGIFLSKNFEIGELNTETPLHFLLTKASEELITNEAIFSEEFLKGQGSEKDEHGLLSGWLNIHTWIKHTICNDMKNNKITNFKTLHEKLEELLNKGFARKIIDVHANEPLENQLQKNYNLILSQVMQSSRMSLNILEELVISEKIVIYDALSEGAQARFTAYLRSFIAHTAEANNENTSLFKILHFIKNNVPKNIRNLPVNPRIDKNYIIGNCILSDFIVSKKTAGSILFEFLLALKEDPEFYYLLSQKAQIILEDYAVFCIREIVKAENFELNSVVQIFQAIKSVLPEKVLNLRAQRNDHKRTILHRVFSAFVEADDLNPIALEELATSFKAYGLERPEAEAFYRALNSSARRKIKQEIINQLVKESHREQTTVKNVETIYNDRIESKVAKHFVEEEENGLLSAEEKIIKFKQTGKITLSRQEYTDLVKSLQTREESVVTMDSFAVAQMGWQMGYNDKSVFPLATIINMLESQDEPRSCFREMVWVEDIRFIGYRSHKQFFEAGIEAFKQMKLAAMSMPLEKPDHVKESVEPQNELDLEIIQQLHGEEATPLSLTLVSNKGKEPVVKPLDILKQYSKFKHSQLQNNTNNVQKSGALYTLGGNSMQRNLTQGNPTQRNTASGVSLPTQQSRFQQPGFQMGSPNSLQRSIFQLPKQESLGQGNGSNAKNKDNSMPNNKTTSVKSSKK